MEKKISKPIEVEEDVEETEDLPEEEITENEALDVYLDEEYYFIQEEYDEKALKGNRKGRSRKPYRQDRQSK